MQLYLKSETYVHHHGSYYLVPLMVSVYMYTYLLINLKSDFFSAKICKRFRIMTCAEVNVRVGEISDVVMRLRKKITYNEKMHRVLTIALFTWLIVTMINKHHVYIMWLKMTQNQSFVLISWFLKLSSNRWSSFCQIWNQPKHDGLLINGAIPVYLGMIICSERYAKTIALFFIHNTILISYERMNDMNKNKLYQNLLATCVKYTCVDLQKQTDFVTDDLKIHFFVC